MTWQVINLLPKTTKVTIVEAVCDENIFKQTNLKQQIYQK